MNKLLKQIKKEKKILGDVIEVTSSKRIYFSEYTKQGIPFFRSKEIIEAFKGRSISSELFISEEKYDDVKNRFGVPKKGDILLTSIGTIGIPFRITNDDQFYFKDGNLTWFKNHNGVDSLYLYYWIISNKGQQQIKSNSIGSSQSALTIDSIKKMEIDLPDLPTQKKISSMISIYDAKIENNNKIIKNLEVTAQTIFNEWFVKLQFPGCEKAVMVESEMGKIPYGWNIKSLGELCDISIGRTPPRDQKEWFTKNPEDVKWASIKDMGSSGIFISKTGEFLTREAIDKFSIPVIPKGTVIVSFKLTVGRVAITTEEMLSNEAIAHLKIKKETPISTELLYLIMKKYDYGSLSNTSSIATAVNSRTIKNIKIISPDEKLVKKVMQQIKPIFQLLLSTQNENISLKNSRDRLLAELI